jgi:hypothetical protein
MCCLAVTPVVANACDGSHQIREATLVSIKTFIQQKKKAVLTFTGYSGSGYQDPGAMMEQASRLLDKLDPLTTLINIGATAEGIGAVYAIAKRKGFTTMGIVSTLARDEQVTLSTCVNYVFYVKDTTWGGRLPGSDRLSPTSNAIVENSTSFVAIGGGEVTRDEMLAARQTGKPVTFIPADMNHEIARQKAKKKGHVAPSDFRGSAHEALTKNDQR